MNEKIQFPDSLMDKRLSFAFKRCAFESRSVSFFFLLSFNSLDFILDFMYTWIDIYLNLAYVYYTHGWKYIGGIYFLPFL